MPGEGELAAAFRGMVEDVAQTAESAGSKMADFYNASAQNADDGVTAIQNSEDANLGAIDGIRSRVGLAEPGSPDGADSAAGSSASRITRMMNGEGDGTELARTGGAIRPQNDGSVRSWELDEKWASDAYDSIRAANDVGDVAANVRDVPRPDGNTGFTPGEIQAVKDHVFVNEHPLDVVDGKVVTGRFDPSPDIAEAWLRLRAGTFKPQDVTLLTHELAESQYWQQHPEALYEEAHAAANQTGNWQRDVPPRTGEDYSKPWR